MNTTDTNIPGRIAGIALDFNVAIDKPKESKPSFPTNNPCFVVPGVTGFKKLLEFAGKYQETCLDDKVAARFTDSYFEIYKLNTPKIAMVDILLPKTIFPMWNPPRDPLVFSFDTKMAAAIVGTIQRGQCMLLIDEKQKIMKIISPNTNLSSDIPIILNTEGHFAKPLFNSSNNYIVDSKFLKTTFRTLKPNKDGSLIVVGTNDKLIFSDKTNKIVFSGLSLIGADIHFPKVASIYSFKEVKKIIPQLCSLTKNLKIQVYNEWPLIITGDIWLDGKMMWALSPRLYDADEDFQEI